jgi:very-short-patch-repair endonuclease
MIARRLRRDATEVERHLWRALRNTGTDWKFRRQHPIGTRIADFACPEGKLVIELDGGGQHAEHAVADEARSVELARYGYRVIRFWNNEVYENVEGVVQVILQELAVGSAPPPHPIPLRPQGRRGGGA